MKVILIVLVSLFSFFAVAAEPGGNGSDFAGYLRPFDKQAPGIAVAVLKGRKILHIGGAGLSKLTPSESIHSGTRFDLASVSKQMTAMGVLILASTDALSLDDKVTRFLPELSDFAGAITVKHLLQHTGGFPDYMELCGRGTPVFNDDIVRFLASKKALNFPAGVRYEYSNTGYALLASVIERASGRSYPAFMEREIFSKAGMKETFVNRWKVPPFKNIALSYTEWPFFELVDQPEVLNCNTVYGDGSIYSSVQDMARWNFALDDTLFVPSKLQALAFERGKTNDGKTFDYGFGWSIENEGPSLFYAHDGGWAGFHNVVLRLPSKDLKIIILSNSLSTPNQRILKDLILMALKADRT